MWLSGLTLAALALKVDGLTIPQSNGSESSTKKVLLDVPFTFNSSIRPIDGSWQSFSIEFSYMADYFGNKTHAPQT